MGLFDGKKTNTTNYVAPPAPAKMPSIHDNQNNIDNRVNTIEAKINKCDQDLAKFKAEMKRTRPGTASYNSSKQRALRALKQRKMYEQQLNGAYNQQANLDQVAFAKDTFQDVKDTVTIMQATNKQLQKDMKKIDLDKVEELQDEFEDLLVETHEITEALGRTYEVGDTDTTALEKELEDFELDMIGDVSAPSYLQPQYQGSNKIQDPVSGQGVSGYQNYAE